MEERLLSMFFDVGTCRATGTSPVPWTVAKEYAEYHKINFKFFWQVIAALDSAYLEHLQQKQDERENRIKNRPTPGKRGKRNG